MSYLPYISGDGTQTLGHYQVAQRSGEIAATLAAAGHLARIRWNPTNANALCVVNRIRVGVTVSAAITTAVELAIRAIVVRQFTVDFTTAATLISMSSTANTNVLRSGTMKTSQMGANGPAICTTVVMSGQTFTADNAPFAICSFTNPSTTLGAAALTNQVGCGVPMATLYERGADGFHPLVLGNNEGVVIQNHLAGPGSGTFALYTEWDWAEVLTL